MPPCWARGANDEALLGASDMVPGEAALHRRVHRPVQVAQDARVHRPCARRSEGTGSPSVALDLAGAQECVQARGVLGW
eukprot:2570899-Alexandrium_andersonii.AAC.1